jgi:hypothetical protein
VLIEFRTLGGSKVDLDNATKLVWDALNAVFWADDIQVGDSYLHLVRGRGEPGVEVMLFRVQDNGTPKTRLCECGARFRAQEKLCSDCRKNRAAVRELVAASEPDEMERQKRRAFNYIAGCAVGGLTPPTYANIAIVIGASEPTAKKVVAALIADGALAREGRKFVIRRALEQAS